jgi:hypothetical protein
LNYRILKENAENLISGRKQSILSPLSGVKFRVLSVFLPVLDVLFDQDLVLDDRRVFSVLLLGRFGEIETPGYYGCPIDNHDFVMGDEMGSVYPGGNPGIHQKISRGILLPLLAFVEDDLYLDSSLVGVKESLGNGGRGKRIGLDQNGSLGIRQLFNNGVRAATLGIPGT